MAAPAPEPAAVPVPAIPGQTPAPAQTKKPKEKKPKSDAPAGSFPLELDPKPEFLASRVALFDKLKKEQDDRIAGTYIVAGGDQRTPGPAARCDLELASDGWELHPDLLEQSTLRY